MVDDGDDGFASCEDTDSQDELPAEAWTSPTRSVNKAKLRSKKRDCREALIIAAKKELQALEEGTHPEFNRTVKKLDTEYYNRWLPILRRSKFGEKIKIEKDASREMSAALQDYHQEAEKLRSRLIEDLQSEKIRIESWKARWKSTIPILGAENVVHFPNRALRSNQDIQNNFGFFEFYSTPPGPEAQAQAVCGFHKQFLPIKGLLQGIKDRINSKGSALYVYP